MPICVTSEPMRHQTAAVAKLKGSRVGGLFMDMGTGKSLTAMMLAEHRQDRVDKVWWGCPCSLRRNVVGEILKHTTAGEADIHILTSESRDEEIAAATWIVFGIESVGQSDAVTLKLARHVSERSMMIVDESTFIKGPRAKRTDRLTKIGSVCRYRLVMTGTPLTQGIVDLYAQMRFLSEKILGYSSFWSFARAHVVYRKEKINGREITTDHIIGYRQIEPVIENVAPYVFQITKSECLDLPEKIHVERSFEMTPEQREVYEAIKVDMILNRSVDDFVGRGASIALFRLFAALQKVTAGIHRRSDGSFIEHDRVDTLMRFVGQVPEREPTIVWTKFRACADQILPALEKEYGRGCATIFDGRYTDSGKQANLARWREGRHRFLLATAESGGRGLTLNESAFAFFYADGFKYENRQQGEDRIHRIGQGRRPTYGSIHCEDSIDERIRQNIASKGATLGDFKRRIEKESRSRLKDRLLEFVSGTTPTASPIEKQRRSLIYEPS